MTDMDDPLDGIDLGLLSSGGTGSQFDVRSGEDDNPFSVKGEDNKNLLDTPDVDDDTDDDEGDTSFIDDFKGIGVRDTDSEEDDDPTNDSDTNTSDSNEFWKSMNEAGIIELEDGELDNEELEKDMSWFAEKANSKIEKGIESGINEYKESLPEELRFLIDNYEKGVSITDLAKAEAGIVEYAKIQDDDLEDNTSLQKKMVKDLLALQGEKESDIEEMLMEYEDSGLLEKYAKRAKGKLVAHQKNEAAALIERQREAHEASKKRFQEWSDNLKKDIDSRDEIIPGLKLTEAHKKALFSGIAKLDKDNKNEVMRFRDANPEFDLVVGYLATVLKTKDNKIDWSKLVEVAETKATKNLVKKSKDSTKTGTSSRNGSLSGVDINIMKSILK